MNCPRSIATPEQQDQNSDILSYRRGEVSVHPSNPDSEGRQGPSMCCQEGELQKLKKAEDVSSLQECSYVSIWVLEATYNCKDDPSQQSENTRYRKNLSVCVC